ncbi:TraR/DksA C4-type zinc finger protein [Clostridium cellulovorans]|uniref:Transcriptional regulator, TraR/DksA family n=1 Tax=Clostridium cellulovorans (strain ATCC 35296 / DSM 3052 / OCM 3 / 743B) TaxID=573061 RepID=D9SKL3_CLOC7|nr:TraR/DksA C4-type zinc finger protein [Clostridium cellulovorans]ADL51509.1 transcriptional regulator, TraR/DksA family [Clostridium cellulovorans 743B]
MLNEDEKKYFKNKLLTERERINKLLMEMKDNETIDSNLNATAELSFYDNHPSDSATELSEIEKGKALKANETNMLGKINEALDALENGDYGLCGNCQKEITKERLDFLPYAKYCAKCQGIMHTLRERTFEDRPNEEYVLKDVYYKGFGGIKGSVGLDALDTYELVDSHNQFVDSDADKINAHYVDPLDRVSNISYEETL